MKKEVLVVMIIGLVLSSCNKQAVSPNDIEDTIIGSWDELGDGDEEIDLTFNSDGTFVQSSITYPQEWKMKEVDNVNSIETRSYQTVWVYHHIPTNTDYDHSGYYDYVTNDPNGGPDSEWSITETPEQWSDWSEKYNFVEMPSVDSLVINTAYTYQRIQ